MNYPKVALRILGALNARGAGLESWALAVIESTLEEIENGEGEDDESSPLCDICGGIDEHNPDCVVLSF